MFEPNGFYLTALLLHFKPEHKKFFFTFFKYRLKYSSFCSLFKFYFGCMGVFRFIVANEFHLKSETCSTYAIIFHPRS
jgi:hypothetical protein